MNRNELIEKVAGKLGVALGLVGAGSAGAGAGYALGRKGKKKAMTQAEKAGEFVGSIKTLEAMGYGQDGQ